MYEPAGKSQQKVNPPNLSSSFVLLTVSEALGIWQHMTAKMTMWRHGGWVKIDNDLCDYCHACTVLRGCTHTKSIVCIRAGQSQRVRCLGNTNTKKQQQHTNTFIHLNTAAWPPLDPAKTSPSLKKCPHTQSTSFCETVQLCHRSRPCFTPHCFPNRPPH